MPRVLNGPGEKKTKKVQRKKTENRGALRPKAEKKPFTLNAGQKS